MQNLFRMLSLFGLTSFCFGTEELQSLSLEEKVGQLLMVHVCAEEANEDAKTLIQNIKVGGIIYYNWANGLTSPEQVQTLSKGLQQLAKENPNPIPLLIAADQEGGVVARLNQGFTHFPGNRALGEVGDPKLAESAAFAMGQELRAVGINMNLAPVVDVNSNPRNPVIGVRSFGDQAELVSALAKGALNGYKEAEIITTLKHFPGHGDTVADSHENLPLVRKSKKELEQMELLPFAKLASFADAIMTAHILVPSFDEENCSTLSEKTLNYLKETIGFQGVIVADSLVMAGVLDKCHTVEEAAIQALKAGCHLLILGGKLLVGERAGFELTVADIRKVREAIVHAVQSGRISEARVDQAVQKILDLKKKYIISNDDALSLQEKINTEAHRALAHEIASLALISVKKAEIPNFHEKKISFFAPQILQDSINQTSFFKIGKTTHAYFFSSLSPSMKEVREAIQQANTADILFVCSYNAWKNPSQVTFIQSLIDTGKPVFLFVMRDPLDASLFSGAQCIFNTFSPTIPSLQAICNQLEQK
jgi:beta-N-acetylhexosaminidase